MRISTHEQLLRLLDDVVAASSRGDRTSADADAFWAELLTREGHPLAAGRPDENLVDWFVRGLLGDLEGARVLDVGCGNGRNSRWFAGHGARVHGIDVSRTLLDLVRETLPASVVLTPADVLREALPDGPFDLIYDSGCFHHLPPHRRATYLERVLPRLAPRGAYGIVTLASEAGVSASDAEMLASGDTGGGTTFELSDLTAIFSALEPVEVRRLRPGVAGAFGMGTLNAALLRRPADGAAATARSR
jgi:SAM-dependent methyltransferase